ncbi:MAG: TIGR01440 family protein [Clostridiales bacterium]|jgi:uncharacterized protein (TIGR01440 family)|nr:TIGR01440 family protein [Clostridiales bacterium]
MLEKIKEQARQATLELVDVAKLSAGQIFVVGCSTSEVIGHKIGSNSAPDVAKAIFDGITSVVNPLGIYVAAQCCEHLNRAIIIEKDAVKDSDIVNIVPVAKAGGSFATVCYNSFNNPVAVETIKAHAGLDIGATLIGMHLKSVAVPVRLNVKHIGQAILISARTRPKFIGGERAKYNQELN